VRILDGLGVRDVGGIIILLMERYGNGRGWKVKGLKIAVVVVSVLAALRGRASCRSIILTGESS
jgi:hypothetical protein